MTGIAQHRAIGPSLAPGMTFNVCLYKVLELGETNPMLQAMNKADRECVIIAASKLLYAWHKSYERTHGFGAQGAIELAIKIMPVIKFEARELDTIPAELANYREHTQKAQVTK